jgi:hypothetical protein
LVPGPLFCAGARSLDVRDRPGRPTDITENTEVKIFRRRETVSVFRQPVSPLTLNAQRRSPGGPEATPLKEVLQTMKKNKYKFPASIEYEYNTPEGSDAVNEGKKCVAYCKNALA